MSPISIPIKICVEFEFSFLLIEISNRHICDITVPTISHTKVAHEPNFSALRKSSHECLSHECGGFWPHLAF